MKSSQQKPETTSPAVINSSIGVLQFKEKHSNGKATSLEVLPQIKSASTAIPDVCAAVCSDVSDLTARRSLSISLTFAGLGRIFVQE